MGIRKISVVYRRRGLEALGDISSSSIEYLEYRLSSRKYRMISPSCHLAPSPGFPLIWGGARSRHESSSSSGDSWFRLRVTLSSKYGFNL